mgnify:CR=1 FL=1
MKMNTTKVSAPNAQTPRGSASASTHSMLENTSTTSRLLYSAASVGLIGIAYVVSTAPLGMLLVLPLLGIYTGLGVVLGRSPLATVIDANKAIPYVVPVIAEDIITPRTKVNASRAA